MIVSISGFVFNKEGEPIEGELSIGYYGDQLELSMSDELESDEKQVLYIEPVEFVRLVQVLNVMILREGTDEEGDFQ